MHSNIDLAERLSILRRPRILVVGDVFIDRYVHCRRRGTDQAFPDAPVLVVESSDERQGGAGAVRLMVDALGGDDHWMIGYGPPPVEIKERVFVDGELVSRIDRPCEEWYDRERWRFPDQTDAVLIADYGKGTYTPEQYGRIIAWARSRGIPCIVDPAPGVDWKRYEGATAIKCNEAEAKSCSSGWKGLCVVTRGSKGIAVCNTGLVPGYAFGGNFAARKSNCVDPTGCGDMVLAAIGVCMAGGFDIVDACRVANVAAGLKCERRGAVPVSREEVVEDLRKGAAIAWA